METSKVAIDASFLLKLFLPEPESDLVESQWKAWIEGSVDVVAPTLLVFEAASVIRNKVHRGMLLEDEGKAIIDRLKHLDVTLVHDGELLDLAWEIGAKLRLPALYDSFYLALSRFLSIPLWTADQKLFNLARDHFSMIRVV